VAKDASANGVSPPAGESLRILAVADLWQGSDGYAYIRAFRRLGHSVRVVSAEHFVPGDWDSLPLRAFRRLISPALVREYTRELVKAAREMQPHLFFVFKGRYVAPRAVEEIRKLGAVAINFYPDVSFMAHGSYLPKALPRYDWVFQTKTFGIADLKRTLGVSRSSFLPPSFDPEVHFPAPLTAEERARLAADVCFIGTWSPKKERLLAAVARGVPQARLRVWGSRWDEAAPIVSAAAEGRHILGLEYAKAIVASKINLGLLSEVRKGASSGDLITARTFQIPATGAFMLHERTAELAQYFTEGEECACFGSDEELTDKVAYYLKHEDERRRLAAAGRQRSLDAGYAVDFQARRVLDKMNELRAGSL
jgi:glycosyltransferase involved in cell wall biosynthesis